MKMNENVMEKCSMEGKLQMITGNHGLDLVDGKGIELYDRNGKTYLDLNEICIVLGQKHEGFIQKMCEKLHGLTSGKTANSPEKEKLFQYLAGTTGYQYPYIHMTSSGSEASEWAVRMALKMTGRNEVLAFWNSIHGRTYLGASMSGMMRRKQGYAPSAPGVVYGTYPNCAHCPFEKDCSNCNFFCLKFLEEKIKYESSGEIGAVIVESYQGAGIIIPPKGWLKALEIWAHNHGALFIVDEIQSGMGRTGSMYAYQEEGLEPDMILLGKAIGNGLHVGVLMAKEVPEPVYRMALAGGSGDSEWNCAAGCAVFEELLEHGLLTHIASVGSYMEEKLQNLQKCNEQIQNLSCKGLACSFEIKDESVYERIMPMLREKGLIVGGGAHHKIVLRPPYVITEEQVDKMLVILKEALEDV